jgi:hypothetical protein
MVESTIAAQRLLSLKLLGRLTGFGVAAKFGCSRTATDDLRVHSGSMERRIGGYWTTQKAS